MTKAVLCGALGRMGRVILRLSLEYSDFEVVAGVEHPDCVRSTDLGEASGIPELRGKVLTSRLEEVLPLCHVVIEFSGNTSAAVSHTKIASLAGKAAVVGTTGFSEEEMKEMEECSQNAPLLISPNMSLGVNLLFKLVQISVKALKDKNFDMEISEIHHRFKKDAPSGTALKLASIVAQELGVPLKDHAVFGRKDIQPRKDKDIGVFAIRGGDVVGDHTVYLLGFGERIELTHRATSRDTFAKGAIEASRWIKDKPPGLYSMFDVLGL